MKIVVNKCFGGFNVSDEAARVLGLSDRYHIVNRSDKRLIKMVEEDADKASGQSAKLRVVEIPDNATDWELNDYDGRETIIYVVDGKIYHA